MRLFLFCLLVASAAAYNETLLSLADAQICGYATAAPCIAPACAQCQALALTGEAMMVHMGASVYLSLPASKLVLPPFFYLDSIRLPGLIPAWARPTTGYVSQMAMLECLPQNWLALGQVNLFLETGTVEIALKEQHAENRIWPAIESTCGTQGQITLLWHM